MEKCLSFFLLVLLFLLSPSTAAQQAADLIKQGDQLTSQFNNKAALDKYLQADKISGNNWEIKWRISRAYVNIAGHMPEKTGDDKDAQLAVYQKALENAEKAVKLAPDKSAAFLRRAIANGRIALFKGVFSVASVVNSVRDDCEKAIRLNNGDKYEQALAHYVLARTHAKISEKWAPARAVLGLGWADNETAIKEYKKAINIYPDFRMFYLDYAKSLINEDNYSEAKTALKNCISSPKEDEDDDARLAEAKKLLDEIKNE